MENSCIRKHSNGLDSITKFKNKIYKGSIALVYPGGLRLPSDPTHLWWSTSLRKGGEPRALLPFSYNVAETAAHHSSVGGWAGRWCSRRAFGSPSWRQCKGNGCSGKRARPLRTHTLSYRASQASHRSRARRRRPLSNPPHGL